jgi:hypothetical protein
LQGSPPQHMRRARTQYGSSLEKRTKVRLWLDVRARTIACSSPSHGYELSLLAVPATGCAIDDDLRIVPAVNFSIC